MQGLDLLGRVGDQTEADGAGGPAGPGPVPGHALPGPVLERHAIEDALPGGVAGAHPGGPRAQLAQGAAGEEVRAPGAEQTGTGDDGPGEGERFEIGEGPVAPGDEAQPVELVCVERPNRDDQGDPEKTHQERLPPQDRRQGYYRTDRHEKGRRDKGEEDQTEGSEDQDQGQVVVGGFGLGHRAGPGCEVVLDRVGSVEDGSKHSFCCTKTA